MEKIRVGFVMTGSFCTFEEVLNEMRKLAQAGYDIIPIMSEKAYSTDTRFGAAADFISRIQDITGKEIIHNIIQAEPIGPMRMTDIMLVAPCTGNTLAKLALGITDTAATMAVKSHLRNGGPVVLAVSTNDALGGAAKNIGLLINYKNIYFVPMSQDSPELKPRSVVADFGCILPTLEKALSGVQLQPVYH
jgi:dipicolinate synthase subunit B